MAQIIMVPRMTMPIPDIDVPVTHVHRMNTEAQPFAHEHTEVMRRIHVPHLAYDPWSDYQRWYGVLGGMNTMEITDQEIHSKLWNQYELHEYIESLNDTVLIQPNHNYGWKIAFRKRENFEIFWKWWLDQKKQHLLQITIPPEHLKECQEWIRAHVRGQYHMTENLGWEGKRKRLNIAIRDENEALEFKLRWYNVPDEAPQMDLP